MFFKERLSRLFPLKVWQKSVVTLLLYKKRNTMLPKKNLRSCPQVNLYLRGWG